MYRTAIVVCLAVLLTRATARAQCGGMPPGAEAKTVPSVFMGAPEQIVVYLPPDYAGSGKRYPVIYWFHGRGDNQCTQLPVLKNVQTDIQSGAVTPMIYVFINGGTGCNFDDNTCAGKKVESYVMKELIPFIDANYRTVVGPAGRALEGFSMGAEAVLRYFNKYADQFCDAMSYAPIGGSALTDATQAIIRAKGKVLRLVVGTADAQHLPGCRSYEKMLMGINLPHEYEEIAGVPHNPFALQGAMGGMVGLRGRQMHTRCFMAAPAAPGDAGAGVPPAADAGTGEAVADAATVTPPALADAAIAIDAAVTPLPDAAATPVTPAGPPRRASGGCSYGGEATPGAWALAIAALLLVRRRRPRS